jgi:EpsI family protein
MNYKLRPWLVLLLLASATILSFAFPQAKYKGTGFIKNIKIPTVIENWKGKDVREEINVKVGEGVFNFISDILAYKYVNRQGKSIYFIILDAGNFHHPKGCFTSAGYKIKELNNTKFKISGRTIEAHTLFTEKKGESSLSFYWIVIDKKIVHQWVGQKIKQLYFSLFNKKRVGLMVRIDIQTKESNIKDSIIIVKDFIYELSKAINKENSDYIFGKS